MSSSSIRGFLKNKKQLVALFICGFIGLTASFALTLDKIKSLENPGFVPACSINPIITCTSAMSSTQATTFGVPNSMVGIVAYSVLIAICLSLIVGATYSKSIFRLLLLVAIAGFLFTNYLILQSVLVLHVVCPWCFSVWITSPIILLILYRLYRNKKNSRAVTASSRFMSFVDTYAGTLLACWYIYLLILLAVVFREYIATVIT